MWSCFFATLMEKYIQSSFKKGYVSENSVFKLLLSANHGYDVFLQDVEEMISSNGDSEGSFFHCSKLNNLNFCGSPVHIDGQLVGFSFAYPFYTENANDSELSLTRTHMQELGLSASDIDTSINAQNKLTKDSSEYLQELISLVTGEISTYHHEISKREERIRDLNSELGDRYRYHSMIGKSKQMQKIYRLLEKISGSDSSVFVQGENGTGKELVAKAIHFYSPVRIISFLL